MHQDLGEKYSKDCAQGRARARAALQAAARSGNLPRLVRQIEEAGTCDEGFRAGFLFTIAAASIGQAILSE